MQTMKWIPVGSVVKLYNNNTEVLIVSRGYILPDKNIFVYFDYYGVEVNVGIQNGNSFLFNNNDIEDVKFEGWKSPEQDQLEKNFFVNVASKGVKKAKVVLEENQKIGF